MYDLYRNYHALARAIVVLAVRDYRNCTNKDVRESIENFFRSDFFGIICDLDGEELIKTLRQERMMKIG